MSEMKRAIAREEQERRFADRSASTLAIAPCLIAAAKWARDGISCPSPRLTSAIGDSVQLARSVLDAVIR